MKKTIQDGIGENLLEMAYADARRRLLHGGEDGRPVGRPEGGKKEN